MEGNVNCRIEFDLPKRISLSKTEYIDQISGEITTKKLTNFG